MTDDKLIEALKHRADTMNGAVPVGAGDGNTYACGYYGMIDRKFDRALIDALAAKDAALSEMEKERDAALKTVKSVQASARLLEATRAEIYETYRKNSAINHAAVATLNSERQANAELTEELAAAESELERFKNEAAAQFKRDGEKLAEADRRAEALRKALAECRTFVISCRAEANGRNNNRYEHASNLLEAIDAARALAPSIQAEVKVSQKLGVNANDTQNMGHGEAKP